MKLNQLRQLVATLKGSRQADSDLIAELRSITPQQLCQLLRDLLNSDDPEFRCQTALAIFYADSISRMDLLLPMLNDPECVVRWCVCGLLHDLADRQATEPLIKTMKNDSNPQVRNTAASALGGIGDPRAIPSLIETMESEHKTDELGHTASSCAATALDDILKTQHTRRNVSDGYCTMPKTAIDLDLLKSQALELYRNL